ncbi:hypothetical protein VB774_03590 [Pseudanabaena galeata UHCC 0370]|uniref:Uncharacterized protein n=1 Tax=Pseudanabaena galeata UHCC 0370 TaxID=3110310 RepID=A0ABU5TEK1_9CYAN|nr:hypothetical protein [Pseudanabaena galeata UHCC 0370]
MSVVRVRPFGAHSHNLFRIAIYLESKQKPNLPEAVNQQVVEICGVVISSFINANDKKTLFSISLKIDILNIINHFKDQDCKL